MINQVLTNRIFAQAEGPIEHNFVNKKSLLTVVTGENASGKSFFRRCFSMVAGTETYELIEASMEARQDSQVDELMGEEIRTVLGACHGDETNTATGHHSVSLVLRALQKSKMKRSFHCVFLDEPEVGLSERAQHGLGETIAKYVNDPNALCEHVVLVTHSKTLVRGMIEVLDAQPNYLNLKMRCNKEDHLASLEEWLKPVDYSISPEELMRRADEARASLSAVGL